MKNSAPNHFIWAHIFKKAPTSEGGTSLALVPTPPSSQKQNGGNKMALLTWGLSTKSTWAHPGHARDFAWYRGQRPSPARVIKM